MKSILWFLFCTQLWAAKIVGLPMYKNITSNLALEQYRSITKVLTGARIWRKRNDHYLEYLCFNKRSIHEYKQEECKIINRIGDSEFEILIRNTPIYQAAHFTTDEELTKRMKEANAEIKKLEAELKTNPLCLESIQEQHKVVEAIKRERNQLEVSQAEFARFEEILIGENPVDTHELVKEPFYQKHFSHLYKKNQRVKKTDDYFYMLSEQLIENGSSDLKQLFRKHTREQQVHTQIGNHHYALLTMPTLNGKLRTILTEQDVDPESHKTDLLFTCSNSLGETWRQPTVDEMMSDKSALYHSTIDKALEYSGVWLDDVKIVEEEEKPCGYSTENKNCYFSPRGKAKFSIDNRSYGWKSLRNTPKWVKVNSTAFLICICEKDCELKK